ncbi:MAG: M20/M25/M40 family metallo-hydrolase [Clostridia bacterium]|nr:M20/M25/M40 family metallo-hydrolase [Clostridia bacterium]
MNKLNLIRDLTNANGISGFEHEVVEVVKEYADDKLSVSTDSMRNVFLALEGNTGARPVVMIDAHSDEIGFMVQAINGNGLIKFIAIGGWPGANIPAHAVRIRNSRGEYIKGVTTTKPPHFMSDAEKKAVPKIENMFIDIGATSREEVIDKFGIAVANPVIPDVDFIYNESNGVMRAKAFDDRIGCACEVTLMNELADEDLNVDVIGAVSTQEEVGLRGAGVTSNVIKPDLAIVFEGTPADDTFTDKYTSQAALKKGPQVRHRDGSMITHPGFLAFARNIAQELDIPFQDAVRSGGGTDGGKIHLAHKGVPTIVIGVPARYIHSHYGYVAYEDFENAVKWAKEIIKHLDKDTVDSL